MNADVDIKLDHRTGDLLVPRLQGAKQKLWIMSPWVAAEYMELAANKKAAGVDVRVITSSNYVPGQKEAISRLIESRIRILKPENKNLKYIGIGLIVAGIALVTVSHGLSLIASLAGVVLAILGREKSELYWISKLGEGNLVVLQNHPYKMVHAKIYIVDDTVIIGSANLTGNGLKHNIEVMATMQGAELAAKVMVMMSNIQQTSGLPALSYDAIGRDVSYVAPRHRYYRGRRWRYSR